MGNEIKGLDQDQKNILIVYSLYSNQKLHTYLQYTAACALFFYLTKKEFFKYNLNELLVYDYKEARKYIWESKKFMQDINILRDYDLLIRARSRSKTSRDVNAHQCSTKGFEYINLHLKNTEQHEGIKATLSCNCGLLLNIKLSDKNPVLICSNSSHKKKNIDGFLHEGIEEKTDEKTLNYQPFFL